jgi:THO complex subunit 1
MKSKNLIMLRACNELLRRLSRAEDTAFSGRVFIYLFQIIDYGDTSAVNLRGEFHTENVTTYDEMVGAVEEMDVDVEVEVEAEIITESKDAATEPTSSGTVVETTTAPTGEPASINKLYPIFWSIQKYFSQPPQLFESTHLTALKSALEMTLAKFKEVSKDSNSSTTQPTNDEHGPSLRRKSQSEDDLVDAFNPKYLTSPDLFELEVCCYPERRHC